MMHFLKASVMAIGVSGCVWQGPTSALSDSLAPKVDALTEALAAHPETPAAVADPAVDIIVIFQAVR